MITSTYPTWSTPSNLGTVSGGSTASFTIQAANVTSIIVLDNSIPNSTITITPTTVVVQLHGPTPANDTTYSISLRGINGSKITDQNFTLTILASNIQWTQPTLLQDWPIGTVYSIPLSPSYFGPLTFSLVSGELPKGVYLDSDSAVLYGIAGANLIARNSDKATWTVTGLVDLTVGRLYAFTIRASSKSDQSIYIERTFNLTAVLPMDLSADDTTLLADSTLIDASMSSYLPVVLLSEPTTLGSDLGTWQHDNQFVYQVRAWNPTGEELYFEILSSDAPFLSIEPHSGYLTGLLPYIHLQKQTYSLAILINKVQAGVVTPIGQIEVFTLTVTSNAGVDYVFTDTGLITMAQGEVSTLSINAVWTQNPSVTLFYDVVSGTLPPGLTLTPTGLLVGRVHWSATLGTYNVMVRTYDPTQRIDDLSQMNIATHQFHFSIIPNVVGTTTITKAYDIYYRAYLKFDQQLYWENLLTDRSIFRNEQIYRIDDSNFGRSMKCEFLAFPGIAQNDVQQFVNAMINNWTNKRFRFGSLHTVKMRDKFGAYVADVIYVDIVDPLINSAGNGPPLLVNTRSTQVPTIYPPTLPNQLDRLKMGVGQATDSLLPDWMKTSQGTGRPTGWIPAAVLAYVTPGKGSEIIEEIDASGYDLTRLDFHIDRLLLKDSDVSTSPTVVVGGTPVVTGSGPYSVTYPIPTQSIAPDINTEYTVSGNSNSAYNGTFTATASTVSSLTLTYTSAPGTYDTLSYTTITRVRASTVFDTETTTFDFESTTFEQDVTRDKYIYFNSDGAIYDIIN